MPREIRISTSCFRVKPEEEEAGAGEDVGD